MACSLLPLLVAILVVPIAAAATESIPRACESELSFKIIARMIDAATEFETRLVLLGKKHPPAMKRDRRRVKWKRST
jgi:hypothetical protein